MNDEQMKLEMMFDELGVEAGFVEEFKSVDIPEDYVVIDLKECYDDDIIDGKPQLSQIIKSTFENKETGEEETTYRVDLALLNDEELTAYLIRINLKSDDIIQKDVHHASKLFKLVKGLMEIKVGAGCMDNYNRLNVVNLDKIREQIESLDELTLKVVEESMNNRSIIYNSFVVVNSDNY